MNKISLNDLELVKKEKYPIKKYDDRGNVIYYEFSDGSWWKGKYNNNDNQIYGEFSHNYWWRKENGRLIEFKNKKYYIDDKEVTKKEVDKLLNKEEAKEE